jgi:hypothetical protein
MNKLICGIGLASTCTIALAAAADTRIAVSLVGCVRQGADANTFVLMNVKELANGQPVPATATYWLSSTKGLSKHVGHKLQVDGSYSPDRDAGKTARVRVETDQQTGELKVKLEDGGKKVEGTAPTPVGTAGVVKAEFERPYRRLEVDEIRMIAPSCSG